MENWKTSVLTGAILIILAIIFSVLRKTLTIWMVLVIILGIANLMVGFYLKNKK